jgi:acyl carrier protein
MKKQEFLGLLEQQWDLAKGSLSGDMPLESLDCWDSLAVIGFVAVADEHFSVALTTKQISACRTVEDLGRLLGPSLEA